MDSGTAHADRRAILVKSTSMLSRIVPEARRQLVEGLAGGWAGITV